ncbi:MAG TPA: hypothetical protein VK305_12175 [Roseateles sp.]|nr:hypothetical protein [Roseateles sp.]
MTTPDASADAKVSVLMNSTSPEVFEHVLRVVALFGHEDIDRRYV